jgi:hypothetical protein
MKCNDQIQEFKRRTIHSQCQVLLWLTHVNLSDEGDGEADIGPPGEKALPDLKKGKQEHFNILKRMTQWKIASMTEANFEEEFIIQSVNTTAMKSFKYKYQLLSVLFLLLVASTGAMAQVGSLTKTEAQTVCMGTVEQYGVVENAGSTYSWTLTPSDGGTISGNTNLINITWTKAGTYELEVVERNASGCEGEPTTLTITVNPQNTIALSSASGTESQTICLNNPAIDITYATTGASGASVTGLPLGLTNSWANNVFTITGTPTESGTFSYTVTTVDGCGIATATGTIHVLPVNTIALNSAGGTDSQTVCINSPAVNITYATAGATGADVTGLPTGLTGSWANNVFTISGTPTVSGIFSFTVTTTGGCGTATATGTMDVLPANTIALSSATGTDSQTVCIDNPAVNITYTTTGVTGAVVTNLPAGVNGIWADNVVTISGTPTVSGIFNYTVTTSGGCGGTLTSTGTIDVTPANTLLLTSVGGTDSQTVCIDNSVVNITYATTGATNASVTGLPTGVNGSWANNVFTISGTPTVSGIFSFTVSTVGGCGTATVTGTIDVLPANTIALSSATGTDSQTVCIDSPVVNIIYATTGSTNAVINGLPTGVTGVWANNVFTISGTPTVSGIFSFTVTTTGGCGTATATGTMEVLPVSTIALSSASGTNSQTVCANSPVVTITYATTGATGAGVTGLPAGLSGSWANDVFTILGAATESGTFNYTVTTLGGCGTVTATGTIHVAPLPDPTLAGPSPICESSISNIYQTDNGKTNYLWTVSAGGTITAGGTASDTTVTVSWVVPGNQSVTVNYTDQNGCSATVPQAYNVVVTPLPKTSPIYHK